MDASLTQQKATTLGEILVRELGEYPDTLSQWMAHYIGEQMALAATATGEAKAQAEARCFQTILALWSHRTKLPNGFRPFDGFEPILRTLANLDPAKAHGFYRSFRLAQEEPPSNDPKQKAIAQWLEFAESTDYTARHLIDLALRAAANLATRDSTDALLDAASAEDKDVMILRRLREPSEPANADADAANARVEALELQLGRLQWLKRTAENAEKDLNRALAKAKQLAAERAAESAYNKSPPSRRS